MRQFLPILAVISGLSACLNWPGVSHPEPSYDTVMMNTVVTDRSVRLPRICPAGVALHSSFDSLPAGYWEIAHLTASGDWDAVSNTTLYEAQLRKAARLGANGLIVESVTEVSTLGKLVELRTGWIPQRRSSATAIYLPADTLRVRLACPSKRRTTVDSD